MIICDLMMPEVTGMDMHSWISLRHPDLASRMLFVTGGAFTLRANAFLGGVSNPHLEKPFEPKTLLDLVRQVASSGAAG